MKKVLGVFFSVGLVLSSLSGLSVSAEAENNVTSNEKKMSKDFQSVIQIPETTNSIREKATFKMDKTKKYKEKEFIIKFKNDYNVNSLGNVTNTLGLSKAKELGPKTQLLKYKSNKKLEEVLNVLNSLPQVDYAEPNYLLQPATTSGPRAVPDPRFGELWGLKNTGQVIDGNPGVSGIDVKAENAWTKTKGSSTLVVAVIDTGTDINHPDLKDRIWKNPGEVAGDNIDNDKNGYVDDVNGWDFYWGDKTVYDYWDGDEHGTHVSGTIAGTSNTIGVIGLAPNVKIMPLKFLGPNGGYTSDAILAVNYAKNKGVKISNNSWGGGGFSQALYDAIKNSQSLFVAAAGNAGINIDTTPSYPASYDLPNIFSVAALDNRGNLANFSNYGVKNVDVAAPGVDILSTLPENTYGYYDGTSMATPHVTAAAALNLSQVPSNSNVTIKEAIMKTVTPLSSLTSVVGSKGLINAGKAVDYQNDNEIPGTPFTGTKVSNTLDSKTDLDDVYSINLLKGEKITITLTGATGTDFDVYLYNPTAKTVNSSAGIVAYSEKANTSSESFTYIAQENGKYYLDVYAYSGAGSYTANATFGATAKTYENNAPEIGYFGTWKTVSNTNTSGGSYALTNTSGSKAQFVFNGTGIKLLGMKNAQQGMAKITIDGKSSNVSLYSLSTVYKSSLFNVTGLTKGRHVVTIEWTGKAGSGARKSATNINIDSITVYP